METPGDKDAIAWINKEAGRTRSVFDSVPRRADYLRRMAAYGSSFGFVRGYAEYGGRAFYLEFTGGMNDPRVDYWQPAKAAARLQATGTPNPVLLRIDTAGGHGVGSTKSERDEEEADIAAFLFWCAGRPEWQPTPAASGQTGG